MGNSRVGVRDANTAVSKRGNRVAAVARCAAQVVVLEMSPGMSRPNGVDQVSRSPAAMAECPILNTAWKP